MAKVRPPVEYVKSRGTRYVPCADPEHWHPAFPNNTVRMSIIVYGAAVVVNQEMVRLCAWGADDTGLEMDYVGADRDAVAQRWNRWLSNVSVVSYEGLRVLGMWPA